MSEEKEKILVGKVTNFFAKISVAAIELTGSLKVGDTISIEGATTEIEMPVDSMQIQRNSISEAKPGDEVGIKIDGRARAGDKVFLVG